MGKAIQLLTLVLLILLIVLVWRMVVLLRRRTPPGPRDGYQSSLRGKDDGA